MVLKENKMIFFKVFWGLTILLTLIIVFYKNKNLKELCYVDGIRDYEYLSLEDITIIFIICSLLITLLLLLLFIPIINIYAALILRCGSLDNVKFKNPFYKGK
jgi:hypothetical protein